MYGFLAILVLLVVKPPPSYFALSLSTAQSACMHAHVHACACVHSRGYNADDSSSSLAVSDYYKQDQQILISCILSVTVLTLISSAVATVISFGYPREKMEFLRHYSVFNIVSCKFVLISNMIAECYFSLVWHLDDLWCNSTNLKSLLIIN